MSVKILQDRLDRYDCSTTQQVEHALREITQEIALLALFRAGFFKRAAFHGGTMLRIIYGLERFSEDLDFALSEADPRFTWERCASHLRHEFETYGYRLEITDRSQADSTIKALFLKDDSLGKLLRISLPDRRGRRRKLKVKLEVDTNPPAGAVVETRYCEFPIPFPITVHDPATAFAGKIHALLSRSYVKGRDWYDFVWYSARKTAVNLPYLEAALAQSGGRAVGDTPLSITRAREMVTARIASLDLSAMKADLTRFCNPRDLAIIASWDRSFLKSRVDGMEASIR